jgi:hypothetical protein
MALAKPGRHSVKVSRIFEANIAIQARSSVGERHLDVVDVVGSIPSAPTKDKRLKWEHLIIRVLIL